MLRWYTGSKTTLRQVGPRDVDCSRFGHFGWFREEISQPFWKETVEWLERDRHAPGD